MPSLSIVIPVKNEERYLPRLLSSIRAQSVQPQEVIVADAGSVDSTVQIAKQFGARVTQGGVPGIGRNIGARKAGGEWLLFLDADVDLRDPHLLGNASQEVEEHGYDVATADVHPISGNRYDHFSHKVYNRFARLSARRQVHAPGFFILVKRGLHNAIGGFDESIVFCEDHEYAHRASQSGHFGFLDCGHVHISTRRQRRDGRTNMALKFLLAEAHLRTLGPIRHNKFKYTFGHGDHKEEMYG